MDVIQWYPGHMVKAKRTIKEHLKVVDLVVELTDARIPNSSRNPDLEDLLVNKDSVLVLNKADLADPVITKKWIKNYQGQGIDGIEVASNNKESIKRLIKWLKGYLRTIISRQKEKGRINYTPKIMVIGIPNVGKSSLINALGGRASAKTGDKPGVTKGQQWIKMNDFYLLDVPGVLWPKFEDNEIGYRLAATGAIGDHVFNNEEVARWLVDFMTRNYLPQLEARYKLKLNYPNEDVVTRASVEDVIDLIGQKRGCIVAGGQVDLLKVAELILKEFREGKLGKISLETP